MSSFEKLSVVHLKHVLNVKMESFDKEKRAYISRRTNGAEKAELVTIVQEYVEEAEIEKLLAKPNPESNASKKKEAEKKKASSKVPDMTPQQMRQTAKMLRNHPKEAKRQNPQLAGFSDKQILELAEQYEKMAENPESFKKMKESVENMTEEERQELMKFQEDMKAGGFDSQTPGAAPSDSQIETLTKLLKKNPESFKKIMKSSSGMFAGVNEDQLNTMIDQLKDMDPNHVKMILSSSKYLQPLKEYYEKFDKMTYGFAKYILGFLAIVALYYLAIFVWWLLKFVWWVLTSILTLIIGGGEQKVAADVVDLPKTDPVASVGGNAAKGGDEFEF
jgi:hypothetical protein